MTLLCRTRCVSTMAMTDVRSRIELNSIFEAVPDAMPFVFEPFSVIIIPFAIVPDANWAARALELANHCVVLHLYTFLGASSPGLSQLIGFLCHDDIEIGSAVLGT